MFASEYHVSASEELDLSVIIKKLIDDQTKPIYNSFF